MESCEELELCVRRASDGVCGLDGGCDVRGWSHLVDDPYLISALPKVF